MNLFTFFIETDKLTVEKVAADLTEVSSAVTNDLTKALKEAKAVIEENFNQKIIN